MRRIAWVCSIGLTSAAPLHTRQTSTNNSHSAKIIAPVVVVAVVCVMLVAFGWWKRRKRTQELIQQLQTPATSTNATNNANNTTNNATTTTTPSTGADAPARPPRRRRRRRPSQISTKSLPAYNEQAGDEEIVLVRRTERDAEDESDDDSNENNGRSAQASTSHAPDSRPLLDEDSSPDMPRVSLASSTHGQNLNDPQLQSEPEQQSRAQSQLGHESIANTTTVASSIADTEQEHAHPHGEVPSYIEAMSTSHVNLPSTAEHSAQPSGSTATDDGPPPADANATVRPKRKSVFRHLGRFNPKPSNSTPTPAPAPEAVEMSARTSTSTHRPSISISGHRSSGSTSTHRPSTSLSANQHKANPSLSSLSLILTRSQSPSMSRTSLNISAPIPSSLVRTELSYPRAGPTPEQIRFLSSRESLGRFGMPYGEEAIAAARSRDQLHLPPMYIPRGGESSPSGAGPSASGSGTGIVTAQEDEPTVTIRRGPMQLTPGELAQRKTSETASASPEPDRPDPAMTITEEPIAVQGSPTMEEDTKSVQEEAVTGQEQTMAITEEPLAIQSRDDERVEPRRLRESPYDDGRRESVMSTNSFVTATEGQGDSSPPTPTAETYQSQVHALTGAQSHSRPSGSGAQSESESEPQATSARTQVQTGAQVPARAQTVLIPQSDNALYPELTLVPATPIG